MSRSITATRGDLHAIAHHIRAAHTIAVVGHIRPDADAIGSVTALVRVLGKMGKSATGYIGQYERCSETLYTIPGAQKIVFGDHFKDSPDLIITVDCAELHRTGLLSTHIEDHISTTAVIDHHDTNPGFGQWNYVEPQAESTTVILARLIEILGAKIDRKTAHSLYAGLVTDTSNFRWGRPSMHLLASQLLDFGLDPRQISGDLIDHVSATDARMIGKVLEAVDMLVVDGFNVAVLTVPFELTVGRSKTAVEKVVDFANSISGADIGVVFKGVQKDFWSVSLRSAQFDISSLAALLGGGGHAKAAAFTATGSAPEILSSLVDAMHRWHRKAKRL